MSNYFGVGVFYLILITVIQSIVGSFISSRKFRYFHETGIAILLGMTLSAVSYFGFDYTVSLNSEVFTFAFLPCIVFSEGFSMKKRHFFKNFKYIFTYGFLGTILNFLIIMAFLQLIFSNNHIEVQLINEEGKLETQYMSLNGKELILFCAALSSKDSFLASTMVDHHANPMLFHIIFGEGIMNDATSLVLFESLQDLSTNDQELDWNLLSEAVFKILESLSISMLCGVFFGLLCSVILRQFSFISKTVVHEIIILFMCSYASYCIAESFHYSGVVALLFSGLLIGHFAYYNLSEKAKICSNVTFQTLSSGAENFLFAYIGFTTFSYFRYDWSISLILWVMLFLITGRVISIFFSSMVLRRIFGRKKFTLDLKQIAVLQLTGITRGILGYILANDIDSEKYSEVIQSTILGVVVLSTLFFGLINPKLIDCLVPPVHHGGEHDEHHNNHEDHQKNHDHSEGEHESSEEKNKIQEALLFGKYDKTLFKSKLSYHIQRFNAKYLKPFLIRDYYKNFEEIVISKEMFKEDKYELMRPDGVSRGQVILRQSIQDIKLNLRSAQIKKKAEQQSKESQSHQNSNEVIIETEQEQDDEDQEVSEKYNEKNLAKQVRKSLMKSINNAEDKDSSFNN